jgi:HupE / UreJ protein
VKRVIIVLLMLLSAGTALAHGISDADRQDMIDGGVTQYIKLGASHMLTGYDHLLFLLGVVFFLTKFRDIAKFITAFTVGHSITLIFATFMGISTNYYLIDAVIALTVVYKGFDNLGGFRKVFKIDSPSLVALVFIFGLVHGFGLSTRLQLLPLGDEGLLLRILSFNLGVELGQIVGLSVMLFVLNAWRRTGSFLRFSRVVNVGLVLAGLGLFVFQLNGYAGDRNAVVVETSETEEVAAAWQDTTTIIIPANGAREYKFGIELGAVLEYEWQIDAGELYYDFHGEAHDAKPDEFTSFEIATSNSAVGTLTAPFTGRAGWYWKNKADQPVVIQLYTRGQYALIESH